VERAFNSQAKLLRKKLLVVDCFCGLAIDCVQIGKFRVRRIKATFYLWTWNYSDSVLPQISNTQYGNKI